MLQACERGPALVWRRLLSLPYAACRVAVCTVKPCRETGPRRPQVVSAHGRRGWLVRRSQRGLPLWVRQLRRGAGVEAWRDGKRGGDGKRAGLSALKHQRLQL